MLLGSADEPKPAKSGMDDQSDVVIESEEVTGQLISYGSQSYKHLIAPMKRGSI